MIQKLQKLRWRDLRRKYALHANRTFFASSTDHTALLKDAEVHCIPCDRDVTQYILAASGMDAQTVQSVPQLHLARLYLEGNYKIYGAKVVNRTLGDHQEVCCRLLDAALEDAGADVQAWSTLHGLSDWIQKDETKKSLQGFDELDFQLLDTIAKNENESNEVWERAAIEFVNCGLSNEANLYRDRGLLDRIEHGADSSEYADTSAGTMAVFRF